MGGQKHDIAVVNEVMDSEVSRRVPIPKSENAKEALGFEDNMAWVRDDTKTKTPGSLIGRVYYKLGGGGKLRSHAYSLELEVDEQSKLDAPIVRQEIILNQETAANAGFLDFVSAKVGAKELLELRVIDNATASAKVVGQQWLNQLDSWFERQKTIFGDGKNELEYCAVVTGVVQKYVSTKRFSEFEATGKGGGYGVNVGGRLYVSSSGFELDIVYGLSLQDLTPFIPHSDDADAVLDELRAVVKGSSDLDTDLERFGVTPGPLVTEQFRRQATEAPSFQL
ncbi:hypothetical protein [Agromyces sp. ZXT2-6]|uniref:hypothetical protein n=1 Tax=Agromyces sp. ZXT2-6 TaxID=3461153 RepID=UPI004054AF94